MNADVCGECGGDGWQINALRLVPPGTGHNRRPLKGQSQSNRVKALADGPLWGKLRMTKSMRMRKIEKRVKPRWRTVDGAIVRAETVLGAPNSPASGQRSQWCGALSWCRIGCLRRSTTFAKLPVGHGKSAATVIKSVAGVAKWQTHRT